MLIRKHIERRMIPDDQKLDIYIKIVRLLLEVRLASCPEIGSPDEMAWADEPRFRPKNPAKRRPTFPARACSCTRARARRPRSCSSSARRASSTIRAASTRRRGGTTS